MMGGWASAKLLLDLYGHFLPTETTGYADSLADTPKPPYTAPPTRVAEDASQGRKRMNAKTRTRADRYTGKGLAPREGFEPPTRRLEGDRSIQLSYRGAARN